MMRTYPSRPLLTTESEVALAAYAVRYSRAECCLFSHLSAGEDARPAEVVVPAGA